MVSRYYRLEVVCERLDIPRTQLRRYERLGLIKPSGARDSAQDAPRYSEEDLLRIRRIRRLQRDLGLDMAGVEVVVRLLDQIAALQQQLEERQ